MMLRKLKHSSPQSGKREYETRGQEEHHSTDLPRGLARPPRTSAEALCAQYPDVPGEHLLQS